MKIPRRDNFVHFFIKRFASNIFPVLTAEIKMLIIAALVWKPDFRLGLLLFSEKFDIFELFRKFSSMYVVLRLYVSALGIFIFACDIINMRGIV